VIRLETPKNQAGKSDPTPLLRRRGIRNTHARVGFVLSFFGGVASGLLGVGGGSILVPIIRFALDFPIHFSVPTSTFIMIFTSITGVAGHLQQGDVSPFFALYLGAGSIIGAQVGAWTSKKLSSRDLHLVFAVMLIVASVNMILKSLKII
jgi:uncharacterized membrane protein YfcA